MTLPGRMAILACMDPRLHPREILGASDGEGYSIRDAGGRASDDAIRSLVICTHLLGVTTCAVIHHTDCEMMEFTNEEIRAKVGGNRDLSGIEVREDVEAIRRSPLLPEGLPVAGDVYEVESGRLRTVVTADP